MVEESIGILPSFVEMEKNKGRMMIRVANSDTFSDTNSTGNVNEIHSDMIKSCTWYDLIIYGLWQNFSWQCFTNENNHSIQSKCFYQANKNNRLVYCNLYVITLPSLFNVY